MRRYPSSPPSTASAPGGPLPFVRTRTTWRAYLLLGYYSYLINALGPAMPFLRGDLHLSHTWGSLHSSAFALGMIGAGLSADRLARRWGRAFALRVGIAGMACGTLLFVLGRTPAFTLPGALAMGALGTLLLALGPALLAEEHGPRSAAAMAEANVAASCCALLAPLAVGLFAASALGWRGALLLGATCALPLLPAVRREPGAARGDRSHTPASLPRAYWAYWAVILCAVSVEFSMLFWTADFLHDVAGLPRAVAAGAAGTFLGALLLGRLVASRLVRTRPAARLLPAALILATAGFLLYWLAPTAPVRLAGLFVAGLGVAPLYPLSLSLAVAAAPGRGAAATARASLASGTAIFAAPLVLGWLADGAGIDRASGIVLILLGATAVVGVAAARLARPSATLNSNMPVRDGICARERVC